jgi:hypothetical protein
MIKKILIVAIIFFIVAVGVGWYVFYYKKPTKPISNTQVSASFPVNDQPVVGGSSVASGINTSIPISAQIGILTELFADPVAGDTIIGPATNDTVRFTERATGHIDDISLITGQQDQVSNTTIPKIYESLWFNTGSSTVFRYLDDKEVSIQSYSANLLPNQLSITSTSTATLPILQGSFLPDNIETMAISPSGKQVFYIVGYLNGQATGNVSGMDGSDSSTIFSSPVNEWAASWPATSIITLTTKPASGQYGFMYFLSPKGTLTKEIGNIYGLVTNTDPTGSFVAYSDENVSLGILNTKTGITTVAPFNTFADKCVWSRSENGVLYCAVPSSIPAGTYPDSWYQGSISFSDKIYRYDTINNTLNLVEIGNTSNASIDATNLVLSQDDDYITFINKNDLSLWGIRLFSEQITSTPKTTATASSTNK